MAGPVGRPQCRCKSALSASSASGVKTLEKLKLFGQPVCPKVAVKRAQSSLITQMMQAAASTPAVQAALLLTALTTAALTPPPRPAARRSRHAHVGPTITEEVPFRFRFITHNFFGGINIKGILGIVIFF